jgi:hypothetical protein
MIDNMVPLKQAMEQMDSEDPNEAQAAKDRAAQTLGEAGLSFSKMADVIERRGLLLRPRILTGLKRMDQPGMLGDAAFRDTGSALRKEGQSFYQIADAIERTARPTTSYEDPPLRSEPIHELPAEPVYQMPTEPAPPSVWFGVLTFLARMVFFPLLHPIRFLTIVLLGVLAFYALRGVVGLGQEASSGFFSHGTGKVIASIGSFVHDTVVRPSADKAAPPRPPASIPSPSATAPSPSPTPSAVPNSAQAPPNSEQAAAPNTTPATPNASPVPPGTVPSDRAQPPPAAASNPSADTTAPLAPPSRIAGIPPAPRSTAPGGPPASTSRQSTKGDYYSRWAGPECEPEWEERDRWTLRREPREQERSRTIEEIVPEATPRNSRVAGRCFGGVGGCYWGGN